MLGLELQQINALHSIYRYLLFCEGLEMSHCNSWCCCDDCKQFFSSFFKLTVFLSPNPSMTKIGDAVIAHLFLYLTVLCNCHHNPLSSSKHWSLALGVYKNQHLKWHWQHPFVTGQQGPILYNPIAAHVSHPVQELPVTAPGFMASSWHSVPNLWYPASVLPGDGAMLQLPASSGSVGEIDCGLETNCSKQSEVERVLTSESMPCGKVMTNAFFSI